MSAVSSIVRRAKYRTRWAGHVAGMGRKGMRAEFWSGNVSGTYAQKTEKKAEEGRITLRWIL